MTGARVDREPGHDWKGREDQVLKSKICISLDQ
jgi:hypothetical protein